jgi:predicted dehydrogenase
VDDRVCGAREEQHEHAYLHCLACMPDVLRVGLHDPNPQIVVHRAAAVGNPPIFTDYAQMLGETHSACVLRAYKLAAPPYGTERS